MLHFISSQKGNSLINFNGFLHNKHRVNKKSIVWKCIKYKANKCNGEIHTNSEFQDGKPYIYNRSINFFSHNTLYL